MFRVYYYTATRFFQKIWDTITTQRLQQFLLITATAMFVLGYFESLRWPFPGPKATHGFLKLFFLFLSAVCIIFHKKLPALKWRGLNILMGLFVLAYCLSAALSLALDAAVHNLWYPFIAWSLIAAFSYIKLPKNYLFILVAISSVLIFVTFTFAFFSLMFRYSVDNLYYFIFLDHRANHLLGELREFGKYVSLGPYMMVAPLSYIFIFDKTATPTRKALSFFVLIVTVLTAVISNNRIDVLVVAVQLLVLAFILPIRWTVISIGLSIPIIIFGLYVTQLFFGFNLMQRILEPQIERDLETIDMRYTYWQTAFYNFRTHPFFGTGPNSYNDVSAFPLREYYDQGAREYLVRADYGIGIHNIFIERLADTGLAGFCTFMALLFYFVRRDALALLGLGKRKERIVYLLFSLSAWSWILYGITDNGYGAQGFVTFFFLRGVLQHLSASGSH